jgi:hypothetical protein
MLGAGQAHPAVTVIGMWIHPGWSVVVHGVLMSVDDAWHANLAVLTILSCPTELSPANPPRNRLSKMINQS